MGDVVRVQVGETEQDISGVQPYVVLIQAAFGAAADAIEEGPTGRKLKDEVEVRGGGVGAVTGDYVRRAESREDAVLVLQRRGQRELGRFDGAEAARVELGGERDCGGGAAAERAYWSEAWRSRHCRRQERRGDERRRKWNCGMLCFSGAGLLFYTGRKQRRLALNFGVIFIRKRKETATLEAWLKSRLSRSQYFSFEKRSFLVNADVAENAIRTVDSRRQNRGAKSCFHLLNVLIIILILED